MTDSNNLTTSDVDRTATNRKPTVCQLLHSLSIGGAEILAARIGRQLSGDYRFVYACLDDLGPLGQELADDGFTIRQLNRGNGLDYRCARRLRQLLREEQIDLLHAHQFTPYFYATLARAPSRTPPILFTEHGRFHPDFPSRKRMLYNRVAISRRDRIVAVGEAVRQALITNEGFPANRVDRIYNGINLEPFLNTDYVEANKIRTEFNIADSTFLIAHVARLDSIKDHLTAMRAVSRLVDAGVDAKLLIVGDGPERSTIERARAELSSSNIIIAGIRRDIPAILAAADAFLLTSLSEGIPLTVIEAMASSLPVVATDVGGLSEVVIQGETGFLAPARDALAISNHLRELVNQPARAAEFGAAGRALAKDRFSEQAMIASYSAAYSEMIARLTIAGR